MNWQLQIENELRRVQPNKNPGRTRTIARRAAGVALQQFYSTDFANFFVVIQRAAQDKNIPEPVRQAAIRLEARIDENFKSPSVDPIGDAMLIVEFVKKKVTPQRNIDADFCNKK